MSDSAEQDRALISGLVRSLNQAWIVGRWEDLAQLLHADVVTEFPGFSGRSAGRATMVDGFEEFCASAKVHKFDESEVGVSVIGSTAVANYTFDMVFERDARKYHGTGRDLWVFSKSENQWRAVWRTMLDINEQVID